MSEILDTKQLYRVEKKDIEKLQALLSDCFHQDPLYLQLIPQTEMRRKLLPELFRCDLDELFESCEIYADSPDLNGIIVVSDETERYDPLRFYAAEIFYLLKTYLTLIRDDPSMKTFWNFVKGKDYLNSCWTDGIGTDLRLHIVYFAVRPSMHGKGVASKLMRAVIDYARRYRLAVSLETHNEKNVGMYEHYGFQLFEVVEEPLALKQYCMVLPQCA